jgi:hypothetical protein
MANLPEQVPLVSSRVQNTSDLGLIWGQRASVYGPAHQEMDDLVKTYEGSLPERFMDYFHDEMHVHIVNMTRLAWDDIAALSGKVFPVYVEPDNDTPTAKRRAEKQENIAYGYNDAGRHVGTVSYPMLKKVLMWWLVGTANAVQMVLPDYRKKTPYFTFRDPRTYYPPVGWSPYTQAEADDGFFAYRLSVGELKRRFPEAATELDASAALQRQSRRTRFLRKGRTLNDDEVFLWVGEYYTKDTWMVATIEDKAVTLARSDTGDPGHPDVQPVIPYSLYSPSGAKGRSLFSDQVSIQAAMSRMFSQKLDFFDRTLYPLIFHTPLAGRNIRIGPFATNEFDVFSSQVPPRVDTVSPAQNVDADTTLQFAIGLSRMLNRNPESFQGGGEADSAKALDRLQEGVNQTVREHIWPPVIEQEPKAYTIAAQMDMNLFGSVEKTRRVTRARRSVNSPTKVRVDYVPSKALEGRVHDFEVEPGLGLGGWQGVQEVLMLFGAEAISEDMLLEQLPNINDPQKVKRAIQSDRLRKLQLAELAVKAEQGRLAPDALAELDRRVQEGQDMHEALAELAAQGKLEAPPAPAGSPMGGPPGGGPPMPGPTGPGIPPELQGLIPTPEAMQG